MRHLSQCTRLPLAQCTEQEFEEDLYTFLTHRGEVELANDLRNSEPDAEQVVTVLFGGFAEPLIVDLLVRFCAAERRAKLVEEDRDTVCELHVARFRRRAGRNAGSRASDDCFAVRADKRFKHF